MQQSSNFIHSASNVDAMEFDDDLQNKTHDDIEICKEICETENGIFVGSSLAAKSRQTADYRWKQWCRYSRGMKRDDHLEHLRELNPQQEKWFIIWYLRTNRIKKIESALGTIRQLRMMYKDKIGRKYLTQDIDNIRPFIQIELARRFELEESIDTKDIANADDLFLLLCHHWQQSETVFQLERCRLQLSLYMLLACSTGCRPSAFVGIDDSLKYKDLFLAKVRDPDRPAEQYLMLTLNNRLDKGRRNKKPPTGYVFKETDPLAFDIISHVVALAFDDHAFESQYIKQPRDLYFDRIPDGMDSLQLNWKDEILEVPLIRRTVKTQKGTEISKSESELYQTILDQSRKLGQEVGFPNWTKLYMFRRGAGEAMDQSIVREGQRVISASRRNRALGHGSNRPFDKFYVSSFAPDVQMAFLGRPSDEKLFQLATHMRLRRDPRAKKEVDKKLENWTCNSEEYLALDARYQELRSKLPRREIATNEQNMKLAEIKRARDACRVKARRFAYREAWTNYFAHNGTLEIERQRCGNTSTIWSDDTSGDDITKPKVSEHREILNKYLFQEPSETDTVLDRREKRLLCINAMIALCRQRDLPSAARRSARGRPRSEKSLSSRDCTGSHDRDSKVLTGILPQVDSEVSTDAAAESQGEKQQSDNDDIFMIYEIDEFEETMMSNNTSIPNKQYNSQIPAQCTPLRSPGGEVQPREDGYSPPNIASDIGALCCPFCFYDSDNLLDKRTHPYPSKYNLWRHCRDMHIRYQTDKHLCPYPECRLGYTEKGEFEYHLNSVHKLHVSRHRLKIKANSMGQATNKYKLSV